MTSLLYRGAQPNYKGEKVVLGSDDEDEDEDDDDDDAKLSDSDSSDSDEVSSPLPHSPSFSSPPASPA
jgi:hypothetical protein